MRTLLLVLPAAVAVTLAGCARPASVPPPVFGPAAVDLVTGAGGYPDKHYVVDLADQTATATCMRAAGQKWTVTARKPIAGTDEDRILDLPARRRAGYGLPARPPSGPARAGFEAALFGSPQRRATLTIPGGATYSYPVGGCLGAGHAAAYGDVTTWARLTFIPQEIAPVLVRAAAADPGTLAAVARWRGCMTTHGLDYADPAAARAAQPPEIAVAVQDAECDHDARLTVTELAARRAAARRLPPPIRADLARLAADLDAAAARAVR